MIESLGTIYLLTFPNRKSYVGQTRRPLAVRLRHHKTRANRTRRTGGAGAALYSAIRKYGFPAAMELGRYPFAQLDVAERWWIAAMDTLAPHGYNMTPGGDANPMLTAAGRKAFDASVRSPTRLAKISAAMTGRRREPLTPEQRRGAGNGSRGRPSPRRGACHNAAIAGQRHYKGPPCKHCGGTTRYTSNSYCITCARVSLQKRRRP